MEARYQQPKDLYDTIVFDGLQSFFMFIEIWTDTRQKYQHTSKQVHV